MRSERSPEEERWQLVSRLFAVGRALPASELEALLEAEVPADEALRREVMRLVAMDREPGVLSGWSPGIDAPALPAIERERSVESPSGHYEVLEEIGRGGMGTVYRACREIAGARQIVALKMISPGMDTRLVIRRFERERRVLAGLEHPLIARLLDAGETPLGRPFLVMEHVEGEPIDVYCDRRRAPVGQRLELVLKVCEAVEYAHRKLVLHRDLKPSNVLVTAREEVKLLDFGMSKLLGPGDEQEPTVSVVGLRWLTPSYASPEMLEGREATTAVDVYGLGALLYALLTGSPPRSFEGHNRELDGQLHGDAEVVRPGRRIAEPGVQQAAIAEARGVDGAKLRRQLAGDLDNILLKALDHDPGRRYGSARELAEDLRRHQAGVPVHARAATIGYRTARFLRRNWRGVALVTSVVAILLSALVAVSWQAKMALRDRQSAELEAAKAAEVTEFFIDLLEEVDPDQAQGHEPTVREVMDRGEVRLRRELSERPKVRAALLKTIGRVNSQLGRWEEAESILREAYYESRRLHGLRSPEAAECLEYLGWIKLETSKPLQAERLFQQSHSIRSSVFGEGSVESADSLAGLVHTYLRLRRLAEAQDLATRRYEVLRDQVGATDPRTMNGLITLGLTEGALGAYRKAVERLTSALEELERSPAAKPMEVAVVNHELSSFYLKLGEPEQALEYGERALSLYEELVGPNHPYTAVAASAVAWAEKGMGRFEAARKRFERILAIYSQVLGPDHWNTGGATHDLGVLAYHTDRRTEAVSRFEEALAIFERVVGRDHAFSASSGHYLAVMAREDGDLDRAEEILEWVVRVRRAQFGPDHPHLAASLHELGVLRLAQARPKEGERFLREALAIRERALPSDHLWVAASLFELAKLEHSRGNRVEAEQLAQRAADIRRRRQAEDAPEVVAALRLLEDIAGSIP